MFALRMQLKRYFESYKIVAFRSGTQNETKILGAPGTASGAVFIFFFLYPNDFSVILICLPLSSYHLPGDSSSSEESSEEEEVKPKPPPAKKKKDTGSQDHKKAVTSNNELKVRRVRHVFCCSRGQ